MNYILFDDQSRYSLLPFTHTRPVADIRCGIYTMRERWEACLGAITSTLTEPYLQEVFQLKMNDDNIFINGSLFADASLLKDIQQLKTGEKLVSGNTLIAFRSNRYSDLDNPADGCTAKAYSATTKRLNNVWDIFSLNDWAIREDYKLLTKGRKSQPIPEGVIVTGSDIFIEEGGIINAGAIINTKEGPVYVGKDAEILEGAMVRGPLAMCEHSVIKMGAKVYGATTLGPGCKVGGELSNVVMFAHSNKGHDGYLGNAVIGEWCNLGADTNCSNLKNNYDEIKIWDEHQNKSIKTGLTFCGLIMGDHSKSGINTMFNTGTIVSVSCNVYGANFPEKFIPAFCWGGSEGMSTYRLDRAMETANRMMARRKRELSEAEVKMYQHIFEKTSEQRLTFTKG